MKWYQQKTGELVGDYPENCLPSSDDGECICPLCGQQTIWIEGEIDQDEQGNPIYGENLMCYPCGIRTAITALD